MTRARGVGAVLAWLLVSIGLWLSDADPSWVALAGIVGAAAAAGLVAFDLGRATQTVSWPAPPDPTPPAHGDGARVPRTLDELDAAVRRHPGELGSRLVRLAEDRTGVEPGVDPLPPSLRRLIGAPARRPPSTSELHTILDEIEAL